MLGVNGIGAQCIHKLTWNDAEVIYSLCQLDCALTGAFKFQADARIERVVISYFTANVRQIAF